MASTQQKGSPDPNHDGLIIGVVSVFLVLSSCALIMRLASKHIKRSVPGYDDYLAITSWIMTLAQSTVVASGIQFGGFGRHASALPPAKVTAFLKAFYALSFLQTTALATAKPPALYLLHRIFITRRFQNTVKFLGLIVVSWWVSFTLAYAFICSPIRANWEPDIPQRCGDRAVVLLLAPIPWILTDFAILIAPLFVIKTLQVRGSAKVGLCALFLTGGLTCIVACYRFKTLFDPIQDETWDTVNIGLWSIIETNVTVVCVCLITVRPVLQYLFPTTLILKTRLGWSKLRSSGFQRSFRTGIPASEGPFGSSTDLRNGLPGAAHWEDSSRQGFSMGSIKPIPHSLA